MPVVVNFCRRLQGLLIKKNNPRDILSVADLGRPGLRLVNRSLGTGTRLLLDRELQKAGIRGDKIIGYDYEVPRHMDVGLEILAGRADVGPGIEAVAGALDLGFLPLRWERFDLLVSKEVFFEKGHPSLFWPVAVRPLQEGRAFDQGIRFKPNGQDRFPGKPVNVKGRRGCLPEIKQEEYAMKRGKLVFYGLILATFDQ